MITVPETRVSEKQVNAIAAFAVLMFVGNFIFNIVSSQKGNAGLNEMIVFLGAAAAFMTAIIHFQYAIILFIFLAPLVVYYVPKLTFFFTIGDAFLLVLTVIFFFRIVAGRERKFTSTINDRTIFLFIFLSVCSTIQSRVLSEGVKEVVQSIEYFVCCYYLFSMAINDRKFLNVVLHTILVVSLLVALRGIYEYFDMGGGGYRIRSTFSHFNANGTFLSMTTTLAFTMATLPGLDRKTRIIRFFILGCNIFALLFSFSRGAWIGAVAGVVMSTQLRGMVSFFKILMVALVVSILISLFVPTNRYTERFKSISDTSETSSKNRLDQYTIASWAMIENPLLGIGVSNNKYYANEVHHQPWNSEIHNLYLHIGAERGIPAMVILIFIFISYFTQIYRRAMASKDAYFKNIYASLMAVMAAFATANLFAYMLVRGPAMFFSIFFGLLQAVIYVEDHEHKEVEWAEMLSTIDLKRPAIRMGM